MLPAGSFGAPPRGYPDPVMDLAGRTYDAALAPMERLGLSEQRAVAVSGARGRVLEVGGGTGLTLGHYGPAVDEVVVCEPEASMRRRLEQRAAASSVPVTVLPAGIPGLGLPAASFDTVVCVLTLCTVGDLDGGLAELRQVLKTDGELLFLEHVIGRNPVVARAQRLAAPVWARVAGGCRLDRDIIGAMRAAGFVVSDCERLAPAGHLTSGTVIRGRAIPRREVFM
jgi:SAM-dependent methyltransferase